MEDKLNNLRKDVCNSCVNIKICDLEMMNKCLIPSKYIGYYRALKYKQID